MAYNTFLADRISTQLQHKSIHFEEKKMFGGLCYLVDDKMCVGIIKDDLMIRIDPQMEATALSKTGCRPMDFTGRPMKGYLYVDAGGYDDDSALSDWIDLCLDFNPRAKSSKKRKK